MIGILNRYLARNIFNGTMLVLVGLMLLFSFFGFIDEMGHLGGERYSLLAILKVLLLQQPGNAYHLLPIAVLVGALYALAQLAHHSELTVMRASGMSSGRLAASMLFAGIPYLLLAVLLGEGLAPIADQKALQVRVEATQSGVSTAGGSMWVRDAQSFVNVGVVLPDSTLLGVRIFEFDRNWRLTRIRFAKKGVWQGEQHWLLTGIEETAFAPDHTGVRTIPSETWTSVIDPRMVQASLIDPGKMSAADLRVYLDHLRRNNQKTQNYEIALWSHIFYPLTPLVMLLLALPFAFHQARAGSIGGKVFAGIMLGLSFHLVNNVFAYMGKLYDWPPVLAASGPSVLYLAAALVMLRRVQRR